MPAETTLAQHTPEPWEIGKLHAADDAVFAPDAPSGSKLIAEFYGPNRVANARLTRTAPELLAALEGLVAMCRADGYHDEILEVELAAIAKVTGGAS